MATTKLVIRKDKINASGTTPVIILYTHNQKSTKIATGEKIEPEHWDTVKGQVKRSYGRGAVAFNDLLKGKLEDVEAIRRAAIQQDVDPTCEFVKTQWEARDKPRPAPANTDFSTLFEQYINDTATDRAGTTARCYKCSLGHVRTFVSKHKLKLTIENFTLPIFDKLTRYLTTDLNQTAGTANNTLKRIKVVMNHFSERGMPVNPDFQKAKLLKDIPADSVHLTQQELDTLYAHDFSKTPRLDRVRDLLVFACSTGLRHSDFSTIRPEHVKGDHLAIRTQKTKDSLKIPLNSYSASILRKYEGMLPKLSQQKFNDFIKEACQQCGIDEQTEVTSYVGSKRITQTVPKYELISSHCGRRTFVTLSLERGMRAETVMKITGHKDLKTLQKYIRVTDKIKEVEMNNVWGQAEPLMKIG